MALYTLGLPRAMRIVFRWQYGFIAEFDSIYRGAEGLTLKLRTPPLERSGRASAIGSNQLEKLTHWIGSNADIYFDRQILACTGIDHGESLTGSTATPTTCSRRAQAEECQTIFFRVCPEYAR